MQTFPSAQIFTLNGPAKDPTPFSTLDFGTSRLHGMMTKVVSRLDERAFSPEKRPTKIRMLSCDISKRRFIEILNPILGGSYSRHSLELPSCRAAMLSLHYGSSQTPFKNSRSAFLDFMADGTSRTKFDMVISYSFGIASSLNTTLVAAISREANRLVLAG